MARRSRNNRFVSLCYLCLKLIDLFKVFSEAVVAAFFLHSKHRPEVSTVRPMFALGRCNKDSLRKPILVHGTDSTANFGTERGRERVKTMLLIQVNNAQTADGVSINVVLYSKIIELHILRHLP